jgi:CPA1 family monovalent cation:H+ antiporter
VLCVTALANRLQFSAPLLLIVAGVGISFIPSINLPRLSPEIILLGFLPPLLYALRSARR